jgi:aspartate/methionine/tyrosine aminotransferase
VNGIRFAYLLLPAELRDDIHYVATNSSGATDGFNVAAALQVMKVLNSEACNRQFIEQIRSRNKALTGVLHDKSIWEPNCTYYVFSKLLVDSERCLTMDQRYFEGPLNSGARINLLVPQAELAKISIVLPREAEA